MDLLPQFHLVQAIREFFLREGFLDVLTPPMVSNPGMETHIHPFQIASAKDGNRLDKYLHTSPEFHMKELLAEGLEKIFSISYCFRDEPVSPIHRSQFLMLEWYRAGSRYEKIMDDCEKLVPYCGRYLREKGVPLNKRIDEDLRLERCTVQDLFQTCLNIDILNYLDIESIRLLIEKDYKDIPLPEDHTKMGWDDYFFLLYLNKIEPEITRNYPCLLIYEFPCHLSALSTLKKDDPRVCERFEIYINGIELCNCFNELRDISLQRERFKEQAEAKQRLYGYSLPEPKVLYDALEKGLPASSGNALGVERLLAVLTDPELVKRYFW